MLMIPLVFYRYILWFVVFGGCLGHLISLFVFTRTCFRSHSTSLHFLALTLADGIFVGIFIPLRILRDGFDIDAISLSLVFCKLSFFIEDCIRILIAWFLTLACIDRFCFTSSNIGLRQLSTTTIVSSILSFFTLLTFLVNIHLLIFYEILLDQCIPSIGTYERFVNLYRLFIQFLIPLVLMSICWIFILKNFYQSRRRISPFMIDIVYNHQILRTKRQINHQIFRMLFLQCFLWLLANLLQLIHEIFFLLSSSLPFLLFFISSQLFRRQIPCIRSQFI